MRRFPAPEIVFVIALLLISNGCKRPDADSDRWDILILTGRNNHDWVQTTEVLRSTLEAAGLFSVTVTTRPDTLGYEDLNPYDALLSNWNSWPENDLRWPEEAEQGLLKYVHAGGGLVFFHSSTSAFYTWPAFRQISTATWIMDSTWHGSVGRIRVSVRNKDHPVTAGLDDFIIVDELWINAWQNDAFEVLGVAENMEENSGEQPAIFVCNYGQGRIFHTILGHDEAALGNEGLQSLIRRGTEWASSGQVSHPVSD